VATLTSSSRRYGLLASRRAWFTGVLNTDNVV
jgi:hypothetical protein